MGVSDGFTASEVHKGAAKLVSLLNMVGGLVGPSIGKVVAECKADYTADLVEQLLPRCDDKCQPMKQCKSRCEQLRSKCVPKSLQGYFPMIKKGGSLRSMIGMVGLTEGSSDLKVIDAWVNKLEKCESEDVTSSSHCLSPAYKGADCNPNNGGVVEDESGGASDGNNDKDDDSEGEDGHETHDSNSGITHVYNNITHIHHDNHVHYHTCDNCKGVVNDLIEQVKGMESQVSGLNTNIKTIMHKHASNYPVGTVVDDESGVGMRPSEENFGSEVIHPHASDGTADAHTVMEKLDKLANSMKDEIKKHKDSQKVSDIGFPKLDGASGRNPKCHQ